MKINLNNLKMFKIVILYIAITKYLFKVQLYNTDIFYILCLMYGLGILSR